MSTKYSSTTSSFSIKGSVNTTLTAGFDITDGESTSLTAGFNIVDTFLSNFKLYTNFTIIEKDLGSNKYKVRDAYMFSVSDAVEVGTTSSHSGMTISAVGDNYITLSGSASVGDFIILKEHNLNSIRSIAEVTEKVYMGLTYNSALGTCFIDLEDKNTSITHSTGVDVVEFSLEDLNNLFPYSHVFEGAVYIPDLNQRVSFSYTLSNFNYCNNFSEQQNNGYILDGLNSLSSNIIDYSYLEELFNLPLGWGTETISTFEEVYIDNTKVYKLTNATTVLTFASRSDTLIGCNVVLDTKYFTSMQRATMEQFKQMFDTEIVFAYVDSNLYLYIPSQYSKDISYIDIYYKAILLQARASYSIWDSVETTKSASFNIYEQVDTDLDAAYHMWGQIDTDLTSTYSIWGSVEQEFNSAFNIIEAIILAANFSIKDSEEIDRSSAFNIYEQVDTDLTSAFHMWGQIDTDLTSAFSIYTAVDTSLTSGFNVSRAYSISQVDSLQVTTSNSGMAFKTMARVDDTHVLVAYRGSDVDGYLGVYSIDSSADNLTSVSTLEFDTVEASIFTLSHLTGEYYIIANREDAETKLRVIRVDISNSYSMSIIDTIQVEPADTTYISSCKITTSKFALVYKNSSGNGILKTYSVDGSYNLSLVDTYTYDSGTSSNVCDVVALDSTHLVVVYTNFTCYAKSFSVDSNGDNITLKDTITVESATAYQPNICLLDSTHVAIAYYKTNHIIKTYSLDSNFDFTYIDSLNVTTDTTSSSTAIQKLDDNYIVGCTGVSYSYSGDYTLGVYKYDGSYNLTEIDYEYFQTNVDGDYYNLSNVFVLDDNRVLALAFDTNTAQTLYSFYIS